MLCGVMQLIFDTVWRHCPKIYNFNVETSVITGYTSLLNYLLQARDQETEMSAAAVSYAVVTCEIKLFQNYFSRRRRPSEIFLFQRVESRLK